MSMNAKKGILFVLMAVVVFIASGCCGPWAQQMREECPLMAHALGLYNEDEEPPCSLSADWTSRNMFHGRDMYPSNGGALNTGVDLNLGNTGYRGKIVWTKPTQGGHENWEWFYFSPYYNSTAWRGSPWQMDWKAGWGYYYFPDGPYRNYRYYSYGEHSYYYRCHKSNLNFQEFYGHFAWPRALPWGVVPYYQATRIWPSEGGRHACSYDCGKSYWRRYGGWYHTFGVYKDWQTGWWGQGRHTVRTGFEATYNSGAGPVVDTSKRRADHDMSHCTFMLNSALKVTKGVSVTAGLNHQVSMDKSVNNDNETWFTVGTNIILDNVE
jgi:hypothetical protein